MELVSIHKINFSKFFWTPCLGYSKQFFEVILQITIYSFKSTTLKKNQCRHWVWLDVVSLWKIFFPWEFTHYQFSNGKTEHWLIPNGSWDKFHCFHYTGCPRTQHKYLYLQQFTLNSELTLILSIKLWHKLHKFLKAISDLLICGCPNVGWKLSEIRNYTVDKFIAMNRRSNNKILECI